MALLNLPIGANVMAFGGPWISTAIAIGVAAACAFGFHRLRGTTLAAPAAWGVVAASTIGAVEAYLGWQGESTDPLSASLWRYAAAAGAFCPLMAVLGAKRPQDRGWQWVVLSLWVILLVPVVQAVAAPSGDRLELFSAWRWLLAALIAMGLLNYLPTRYAAAAILFAIGQTLLLRPFLMDAAAAPLWRATGLIGILAAAGYVHGNSQRLAGAINQESTLSRFNERWFAFRDGWGAFWGLRVLERINHAAGLSHWPVRLHWWDGFEPCDNKAIDAQAVAQIQQTLDSLLRRFERIDSALVTSVPLPSTGRG